MRRFLCLWLPRWPTDRWQRQQAEPVAGPLVLTASGQGGIRLTAVDRAAARMGLSAGMKLADARALVPGLTVADAEPMADAKALAALAGWCTRYSPWCAADGEDGIRLDITGCAHLFGGELAMLRDMTRRLHSFGIGGRGGIADTPAAAWGWARYRPKRRSMILAVGETEPLLPLPTAALRLDPVDIDTLRVLGLNHIDAVAALPRGPLSQRLGEAVLERLDRMFGREAEPISPRPITEPWISRMIFPEGIGRREDIDAAAGRLVEHLCAQMALRGQGARRLILRFFRVDGTVQHIAIGTSGPSHTPRHIIRLLAERLDTVEPGFGIEAMMLEATRAEPLSPMQSTFSAAGEIDATGLFALIDRLQNRLGPNRVVQLAPVESHVPERAEVQGTATVTAVSRKQKSAASLEGEVGAKRRVGGNVAAFSRPVDMLNRTPHPSTLRIADLPLKGGGAFKTRMQHLRPVPSILKSARPLALLPFPEPIEAIAPVPDDPPLSFQWRKIRHRVAFADGPERIGPEWWRADAPPKPRDYYRVEDADGRRFWLYREGLYGGAEAPRWFLHGFFP
jgi:protein ImuB